MASAAAAAAAAAADENKVLVHQIRRLERENRDLRRSVIDLNMRIATMMRRQQLQQAGAPRQNQTYFDIDSVLKVSNDPKSASEDGVLTQSDSPQRQFVSKAEMKGHSAAVYCGRFSPCGKFIATGSLDKTVHLWDSEVSEKVSLFAGHTSGISDLSWGRDSKVLMTGSYDKTIRMWSVSTGDETYQRTVEGLVQTVAISICDPTLCFAGTSKKELHLIDTRNQSSSSIITHSSPIMSLYAYRDDHFLTSADADGQLITWDLRSRKRLDLSSEKSVTISSIAVSTGLTDRTEGRYMAVNDYNNTVRLYDRGSNPAKKSVELICTATGHESKNWPIQCSVFHDANSIVRKTGLELLENHVTDPTESIPEPSVDLEDVLFAVGSTDHHIRVFNAKSTDGVAPVMQRLKGHTGRVYSVDFHPVEPVLVSCSEDMVVRIWKLENNNRIGTTA